jgi:hypothetical protein
MKKHLLLFKIPIMFQKSTSIQVDKHNSLLSFTLFNHKTLIRSKPGCRDRKEKEAKEKENGK